MALAPSLPRSYAYSASRATTITPQPVHTAKPAAPIVPVPSAVLCARIPRLGAEESSKVEAFQHQQGIEPAAQRLVEYSLQNLL